MFSRAEIVAILSIVVMGALCVALYQNRIGPSEAFAVIVVLLVAIVLASVRRR
jgi:hypothetical protein